MSAESTLNAIIANATTTSTLARDKAIAYADQAQTAAVNILSFSAPPGPNRPDVTVPLFDPTIDLTGDFTRAYNDAIADYDPAFQGQITSFLNTYFPDFAGCLKTSVDGWICNTITNGGTGIRADVENAIWERSRSRELLDSKRAEDEAVTAFAARGFVLPAGVLVDAVQRVQQVLSDKISTASRDVAIKQAEIEIENIRFAVDQGVKLRLGVVDALISFLRAWALMRELAIEKAKALIDAKTRLYQSVSAYYSAIIGAAQLVLDYDKLRIDSHLSQQELVLRAANQSLESRVGAAVSAAEAMGAIAGAALSAQNTLAEIGNNTLTTTSS